MRPDIGPEEMRIISAEVKRFKRNAVFSGYSAEDIAQDMALFVWKWSPKFDPEKGAWHAFVRVYARARGYNLIDQRSSANPEIRRRKENAGNALSLDEPVEPGDDGEPLTVADAIPDGSPPLDEEIAFSVDFEALLSTFSDEMRQAVRRLPARTINEVAAEMNLPVTTFRRRIYDPLREALTAFRRKRASA